MGEVKKLEMLIKDSKALPTMESYVLSNDDIESAIKGLQEWLDIRKSVAERIKRIKQNPDFGKFSGYGSATAKELKLNE